MGSKSLVIEVWMMLILMMILMMFVLIMILMILMMIMILLRPADVLSSVTLPGRLAAMDVGVASPHASGAGADCTQSMVTSKKAHYARFFDELRRGGVTYLPVVWSAYGRPHPDATRVLLTIARNSARRRGMQDFRGMARRSTARIAAALWRRAANMILVSWPVPSGGGGRDGTIVFHAF